MAHQYPLTRLPDQQLLDALSSLVRDKRAHDATLLAHIAEVDRRRLYAAEGYSSMHGYCCGVLHLSEGGAYNRITVARAARTFPLIFDKLAAGEVHHAGLRQLVPHLTQDNHRALLDAATHKSKRQIQQLLAQRFPQPDVPTSVRALPRRQANVGASATGRRAAVGKTLSGAVYGVAGGQRQARSGQGAVAAPEPVTSTRPRSWTGRWTRCWRSCKSRNSRPRTSRVRARTRRAATSRRTYAA